MKRYSLYSMLACCFLTGLLTGCSEERFTSDNISEGTPVRARLNIVSSDFSIVQTRLTEDEESEWKNVWIGQFDTNNNLVASTVNEYLQTDGNFVVNLVSGINTKVYCVVNVSKNPFLDPEGNQTTDLINNIDAFFDNIYEPSSIHGITDGNQLAMMGYWTGNISSATNINDLEIYVKKLAAKLKVVVKADQTKMGNYYLSYLRVKKVQLCAVNRKTTFGNGYKAFQAGDVDDFEPVTVTQNTDMSSESVLYYETPDMYLLENMQGELASSAISDDEKNLYAPTVGEDKKDLASYILITAEIDDGKNKGEVIYKVYLGENARTNFDVIRHTYYTVTVTLEGAGEVSTDIRADRDGLYALQFQKLNGTPATTRQSETIYLRDNVTVWGEGTATNSTSMLKVFSGNSTWSFKLENTATNGVPTGGTPWGQLSYSTNNGNTWTAAGFTGSALPSNARIRITMDANPSVTTTKALSIIISNDANPSLTREWRLQQLPKPAFITPEYTFFTSEAGIYTVPVRAVENTMEWKVESVTSSNYYTLEGILDKDGNRVEDITQYTTGHGTILIRATANTSTIPFRSGNIVVRYRQAELDNDTTKNLPLRQYAPYERIFNSSVSYLYKYSSNPMFDSFLAMGTSISWAYNLLEENMDYMTDESKIGAHSTINGKENTLKVFQKIDQYVLPSNLPADIKPSVITPAGICMMMNENYQNITSPDDPNFQWYLPARYHALMDATSVMLGFAGVASGVNNTLWSSTTHPTSSSYTEERYSAFFGGNSVDVSATYNAQHRVRCIRDRKLTPGEVTYPYLKNENGNPVVVVREEVDGVIKGYNGNYTSTGFTIGKPDRFTFAGSPASPAGLGPTMPRETKLSPKFQVAREDVAVNSWQSGAGWNTSATDIASPTTGCMSYTEGGFNDWRIPSEMELRIIGLLGGSNHANIPVMQNSSTRFSQFPGFTRLYASYWANKEHPDTNNGVTVYNRAAYVTINNNIAGTAANKITTTTYRVRCVRDVN